MPPTRIFMICVKSIVNYSNFNAVSMSIVPMHKLH